jgi:hypothetical protein
VACKASKSMVYHVSCDPPIYNSPEGTVACEAPKGMVYHVSCDPQSRTAPRELWPARLPKAWFITSPVTPNLEQPRGNCCLTGSQKLGLSQPRGNCGLRGSQKLGSSRLLGPSGASWGFLSVLSIPL